MSNKGKLVIVSMLVCVLGVIVAGYISEESTQSNKKVSAYNAVNSMNSNRKLDDNKGQTSQSYNPLRLNAASNKKPREMGNSTMGNKTHKYHNEDAVDSEENIQLPAISTEQANEIIEFTSRSLDDTKTTVHEDGTEQIDFLNGHATTSVAVIGPKGELIIRHGSDFLQNVEQ